MFTRSPGQLVCDASGVATGDVGLDNCIVEAVEIHYNKGVAVSVGSGITVAVKLEGANVEQTILTYASPTDLPFTPILVPVKDSTGANISGVYAKPIGAGEVNIAVSGGTLGNTVDVVLLCSEAN